MTPEKMDALVLAIEDNPGELTSVELDYLADGMRSYADNCRKALTQKKGMLGNRADDVQRRLEVAEKMWVKLCELAAQRA